MYLLISGAVKQPKEWGGGKIGNGMWEVEIKTQQMWMMFMGVKISHVRSSERVFLDTFTMLLKYLPAGFKEIVVDCSIRVADCSIRPFLAKVGGWVPLRSHWFYFWFCTYCWINFLISVLTVDFIFDSVLTCCWFL